MYVLPQFCEAGPTSYMERPHFHTHASAEHYSRLESIAAHSLYDRPARAYSIRMPYIMPLSLTSFIPIPLQYTSKAEFKRYNADSSSSYASLPPAHAEYHFHPEEFLKPGKEGKFIDQAEEIKEYIVVAFEKIFECPFPHDINITVCNEKEFRKIAPHPGTIGLSINRGKEGLISEIFVLNDSLARVMLTVGHELGHVLTETLPNPHDEEAKAYAFSLVWMKTIKEHDVAGLSDAIVTERPAENGLHNVAFRFVERLLHAGKEVGEIYGELVRRLLSVTTNSLSTKKL